MFDMIREVYPSFRVKVPSKNEIKEIEISLTGKETELLLESALTNEEVEQIANEQILKVPVEMKGEEPEFVYVKVLFEHELLEGQQLLEAEVVPMDQYRASTYAVLNLYYEYTTVNWQSF